MMGLVDDYRLDAKQILARLVGRYGQAHGLYLFGEVCLLQTLGFEAFRARHTDHQVEALAAQLRPLALWPFGDAEGEGGPNQPPSPQDALLDVARSLVPAPLVLALGGDLFHAWWVWAQEGGNPDAWFEPSRAALVETIGFLPPRLIVTLNDALPLHGYRLYVTGEACEEGEAFVGQDLVLGPEDGAPPALPYAWRRDPAGRGWITWMPVGPDADVPELPRLHWLTAVSRHVSAVLPRHAEKLLSVPRVHDILREAEAAGYDRELERYVSVPELKLVFQALLRQGLPLRPLAPMLESMLTAILADLASRSLNPSEIERLNRQLPVFSTPWLLAAVRRGLGLPEEAPPVMAWPMEAPAAPATPDVSPAERDAWRALFRALEADAPYARFWIAALRRSWSRRSCRKGDFVTTYTAMPPMSPDTALGAWIQKAGARTVLTTLFHHQAVARPLERIRAWLDGAGTLDAEARAMLEAADFADLRGRLARVRHLAERHGALEACAPYITEPSRPERV